MQGQMEVEEILEQRVWAERNGVEPGAFDAPAEAREPKTYRDCPLEYAGEEMQRWQSFGWVAAAMILGVGISALAWNLLHRI